MDWATPMWPGLPDSARARRRAAARRGGGRRGRRRGRRRRRRRRRRDRGSQLGLTRGSVQVFRRSALAWLARSAGRRWAMERTPAGRTVTTWRVSRHVVRADNASRWGCPCPPGFRTDPRGTRRAAARTAPMSRSARSPGAERSSSTMSASCSRDPAWAKASTLYSPTVRSTVQNSGRSTMLVDDALDLGVLGPQGHVGQHPGCHSVALGSTWAWILIRPLLLEPLEAGPHGVLGDIEDAADLAERLAGIVDEAAEEADVDGVEVSGDARERRQLAAHRGAGVEAVGVLDHVDVEQRHDGLDAVDGAERVVGEGQGLGRVGQQDADDEVGRAEHVGDREHLGVTRAVRRRGRARCVRGRG